MDLYKCQPSSIKTFGDSQWWCGDPWITLPCTGDDTHFFNYTNGSVLGIAQAASTPSLAVDTSANTKTLQSSSSTSTASNAATSARDQPQPSKLPVAIGAGIGSAVGVVILGSFLAFLYIRRTMSEEKSNSPSASDDSEPKVNVDEEPLELPDIQRPPKLGGRGRNEVPGTEVRMVSIL